MAERAGIDPERLYSAIRKRASRERWPVPDAIVRRARLQAKVASGAAENAKEAALWSPGESGSVAVQQSRDVAGMGVPRSIVDLEGRELSRHGAGEGNNSGEVAPGGGETAAEDVRGAFHPAPVTAAELVTADLSQLGQRGLRAILNTAVNAAESMQQAPEVRSWNDVQVMTKVISQAAGLDKPGAAITVVLNKEGNATIAGWADADIVDTIA
jgi:hypothetical protein